MLDLRIKGKHGCAILLDAKEALMPFKEVYECKLCHAQRKETNHWWNVHEHADGQILFATFDPEAIKSGNDDCVCGRECAIKLLEQWMQSLLIPQPLGTPLTMKFTDDTEITFNSFPTSDPGFGGDDTCAHVL
jgi:hypothetical protein